MEDLFTWGWIAQAASSVNSNRASSCCLVRIEFFFYVKRKQETRFKYNAQVSRQSSRPTCSGSRSQNLDNFLRTLLYFGIPIFGLLIEACHAVVFCQWLPRSCRGSIGTGHALVWLVGRPDMFLCTRDPRNSLLLRPLADPSRQRSL